MIYEKATKIIAFGATYLRPNPITMSCRAAVMFLCFSMLTACVKVAPVPEDRYRQALAMVDKGTLHLRNRDYDRARASFEMAYDLAPLASAIDGVGCVALMEGRFDDARRLFVEAYKMDVTYDTSLANLALLYDLTGDKEEARRLYRVVLARRPELAPVRNNLAGVLLDIDGDRPEARRELVKASELLPHGVIRDNITRLER